MDQNLKIQLGNIEDKFNTMKNMGLSSEEIDNSFTKAEKDILEKAMVHKYIRKEGDKYIYEEPKGDTGKKVEKDDTDLDQSIIDYFKEQPIGVKFKDILLDLENNTKSKISSELSGRYKQIFDKDQEKSSDDSTDEETELLEGFSEKDFEDYVIKNKESIKDNLNNMGLKIKDLKDMSNYYDLAHILDADTRLFKDLDVQYFADTVRELIKKGVDPTITKSEDSKEKKVAKVMKEWKDGKLKSSSGEPVTDQQQAIAIAMSEAGLSKSTEQQDEQDVEKSEGDRGGVVIGHTESGKPIYDTHDHPAHKDFNSHDHFDASNAHGDKMGGINTYDKEYSKHQEQQGKHAAAYFQAKKKEKEKSGK